MKQRQVPEVGREQVEKAINEWIIGKNSKRNRAIVSRKLFYGVTLEKLAEEFDLSRKQVWNIVKKCETIVFRHIPDEKEG